MKSFLRMLLEYTDLIEKHSQDTNSEKMETKLERKVRELAEKVKTLTGRIDIIENPKLYLLSSSYKGDLIIGAERIKILIPDDHPDRNKSSSYWMNAWEYTLLNPHTEEKTTILEFDIDSKFVS